MTILGAFIAGLGLGVGLMALVALYVEARKP